MAQVSEFHYDLPPELIAQEPPAERGASRMLVISRATQSWQDDLFVNLPRYLRPGDCLVLNDTRVLPARLQGRREPGGGVVEVFLVRALDAEERRWQVLVKPGKRVRTGDQVVFGPDFACKVLARGEFGERTVQFESARTMPELREHYGSIPLPPYIRREPNEADRERYQTVYAQQAGSVAAPTAGLHFTPAILEACQKAGAAVARVTLHVGLGTFAPLRELDLDKVQLHEEWFAVAEEQARLIDEAQRRVCVGTTSVRTLESAWTANGVRAMRGETRLFIRPGFEFQATGAMLTNFHLPESSLLMLVCAFAGKEFAMAAYRHAVGEGYRFFSYGDCMFIM